MIVILTKACFIPLHSLKYYYVHLEVGKYYPSIYVSICKLLSKIPYTTYVIISVSVICRNQVLLYLK